MGRELYEYNVYDTSLDKELLSNVSISEVSRALDMPTDKILIYLKNGYLYKRRYLITRQDKPIDSNFKEEWDKCRELAKKALRDPEAIARFYLKLKLEADAKEG